METIAGISLATTDSCYIYISLATTDSCFFQTYILHHAPTDANKKIHTILQLMQINIIDNVKTDLQASSKMQLEYELNHQMVEFHIKVYNSTPRRSIIA